MVPALKRQEKSILAQGNSKCEDLVQEKVWGLQDWEDSDAGWDCRGRSYAVGTT